MVEADLRPPPQHRTAVLRPAGFVEELRVTQSQKPKGNLWQDTKEGPK